MIRKTEASDPVKIKLEKEVLEKTIEKLREDPAIVEAVKRGEAVSLSWSGDAAEELDEDDFRRLFRLAMTKLEP